MQGPAPRPGYLEQLLVDDGAMELVGGDDQGQDTAVNDELHAEFIIIRVKVGWSAANSLVNTSSRLLTSVRPENLKMMWWMSL